MDCLDGKWWNRPPLVRPPETITSLMLAALYPLASKTLAAPARMVARVATALRCRRGFVVSGVESTSTSIELLKACRSILWLSALTVFAHRQGIFVGVDATSRHSLRHRGQGIFTALSGASIAAFVRRTASSGRLDPRFLA